MTVSHNVAILAHCEIVCTTLICCLSLWCSGCWFDQSTRRSRVRTLQGFCRQNFFEVCGGPFKVLETISLVVNYYLVGGKYQRILNFSIILYSTLLLRRIIYKHSQNGHDNPAQAPIIVF